MNDVTPIDLFRRLTELNQIGIALSHEKDITRLLEAILVAAKNITNADGGTLYRMHNDSELRFEIVRTDSLSIAMGGTVAPVKVRARRQSQSCKSPELGYSGGGLVASR